jgi:hypothetical protein
MEHREAEKHIKGCGDAGNPMDPKDVWGEEVQGLVDRRIEEIRRVREWVM